MKSRAVLFVLATVALLALGCGQLNSGLDRDGPNNGQLVPDGPYLGTTTSDAKPVTGGRLVYALPADTNSFNPALAQWGAYSLEVARALFDTLYAYDARGNPQPNLIARDEHNADYTEWTLTLRPNIRFHNGRTLTAADIVNSSDWLRASTVLKGAYHLTTLDHADIVDELTWKMYSTKPWTTMKDSSTTQLSVAVDLDWMKTGDWAHPIGTGPFKMERWDLGRGEMTLVRNPEYWRSDKWGNRLPYLDSIEFKVIRDDNERAAAVRNGTIDIMMQTLATPGLTPLRELCRQGQLQCFSDEKGETPENYVVLNTTKPPFDDIDARRAVALAIDRNDFVNKVTNGLSEAADGMYAPGSPWYTPSSYPAYDPVEARRLADTVRARNGGQFRFELLGAPTAEAARIMQYLQEAWQRVGIEADISMTENQKKILAQVTGGFQASLTQLFDATHPVITMAFIDPDVVVPGEPTLVFARLTDAELGARMEAMVRLPAEDRDGWKAANAKVMDRLNDLVPFLWLDHAPRTIIARPNLINVVQATLPDGNPAADFTGGAHSLSQIWIRPT